MTAQEDRSEKGGQDLATSTLAEIYAQQGLLERARAIYERISERAPDDPRITERIESLSRAIRERTAPPEPGAAPAPEAETAEGGGSPAELDEGARDEVFEAWLANR